MRIKFMILSVAATGLIASQWAGAMNTKDRSILKREANSIVKEFAGKLKPALKEALHNGGPAYAVKVCSETAPALAKQLSKKTGWSIRRVSLKPRNAHTAIPDTWERDVLKKFDKARAEGTDPSTMTATLVENGRFRFMKAQAVEPVCLTCHGKKIAPNVLNALKKYYPRDNARGYSLGQIRGAFSLIKEP